MSQTSQEITRNQVIINHSTQHNNKSSFPGNIVTFAFIQGPESQDLRWMEALATKQVVETTPLGTGPPPPGTRYSKFFIDGVVHGKTEKNLKIWYQKTNCTECNCLSIAYREE